MAMARERVLKRLEGAEREAAIKELLDALREIEIPDDDTLIRATEGPMTVTSPGVAWVRLIAAAQRLGVRW